MRKNHASKNNIHYLDQTPPPLQQSPPQTLANASYYPPPPHLSFQQRQSTQPQLQPYPPHQYSSSYASPLPPPPSHIPPIQPYQPILPSTTYYEPKKVFKKEMYEYKAPWTIHGLDWSNRPAEKAFRLALGSLIESSTNKLQIITLAEHTHDDSYHRHRQHSNSDFVEIAEADHYYPITKVLWEPYKGSLNIPDLLATTGDRLRIWEIVEEMSGGSNGSENNIIGSNRYPGLKSQKLIERESLINTNGFCEPLTSFDWNEIDPSLVVTSSIDTTCTVWNIETKQLKTQLIAHEEEVYDVAFVADSIDTFVTVGADETIKLFDLRSLKSSKIIYDNKSYPDRHGQFPQQSLSPSPFLHLHFNKIEKYYLATFHMNSAKVKILDIRSHGKSVAELDSHNGAVNCVNWSPNSSSNLCSGGDDFQVLMWDLRNSSPTSMFNPIKNYKYTTEISQLNWSTSSPEWLAVALGDTIKTFIV